MYFSSLPKSLGVAKGVRAKMICALLLASLLLAGCTVTRTHMVDMVDASPGDLEHFSERSLHNEIDVRTVDGQNLVASDITFGADSVSFLCRGERHQGVVSRYGQFFQRTMLVSEIHAFSYKTSDPEEARRRANKVALIALPIVVVVGGLAYLAFVSHAISHQ